MMSVEELALAKRGASWGTGVKPVPTFGIASSSFPRGRRSNDTKKLLPLQWCGIFAGMTFKENGMTFGRGKRNGD
jgi:hypothetical protein